MHLSTLAHHTHAHTYTSSNTQHTQTHTHNTAHTHPPTHTHTHTHPIFYVSDDSSPPFGEGDISVATSASINSTFFAKVANWGRVL